MTLTPTRRKILEALRDGAIAKQGAGGKIRIKGLALTNEDEAELLSNGFMIFAEEVRGYKGTPKGIEALEANP